MKRWIWLIDYVPITVCGGRAEGSDRMLTIKGTEQRARLETGRNEIRS